MAAVKSCRPATFLEPAAQEEAANDAPAGERCAGRRASERAMMHPPVRVAAAAIARKLENCRGRAAGYSSLTPRVRNPYYSAIEQGEVDLSVESKISVLTPKPRKFSYRSKNLTV